MRRQNARTLILEIVEESDFSDTTYNSTYVSVVQILIAKRICNIFWLKSFDTKEKCLAKHGVYKKCV